jgi:signal transduction histidine kinase
VELEQALENAPSDSPQQEVYSSLLDEISRLKAIVQKLLLLSLADAGRLQLQLQPVNLSAILANVVEDCRAQAPSLIIEQQIPPDIRVSADPDLLEQALQNLAGNAIKYNRAAGLIRFDLVPEADHVLVRIANTGPPIPPADQERIFERFYRADPARSARVDGTGLGLSLAREIIRAHRGDLSLEASDQQLTRFAVKLPAMT